MYGHGRFFPFLDVKNKVFRKVNVENQPSNFYNFWVTRKNPLIFAKKNKVAFSLRFSAGLCSDPFGPFSIPTCVQKLTMFLPKLKSTSSYLQPEECRQQAPHRRTGMTESTQNVALIENIYIVYKVSEVSFWILHT